MNKTVSVSIDVNLDDIICWIHSNVSALDRYVVLRESALKLVGELKLLHHVGEIGPKVLEAAETLVEALQDVEE